MNERMCKTIICVGAGGVGKTSTAAMLGMHYAKAGKKTLVITIDPAKRLRGALALKEDQGEPVRVPLDFKGELYGLLPDLKKEWMDFLKASIKEEKKLHDISTNPFYRYMVEGFPGALEIICCHILYRLREEGMFDVIVLDTPPSSNSLSFFEVPEKLSKVLERNIFRLLMQNRQSLFFRLGKRLAFFGSSVLQKTLEKIVGSHFLSEVIDFALSIDALYEPLYKRAKTMELILREANTTWVLVLRPTQRSIEDSLAFAKALDHKGIRLDQLLINQMMPPFSVEQNLDPGIREIVTNYERQCAYEQSLKARIIKSFPHKKCSVLFTTTQENPLKIVEGMLKNYEKDE